jgi:large repetitive protein
VLTVEAPGVLTNDSDPNGDELTAVLVTSVPVASGSLALSADGSFVFTPATGFSGDTSFTYRASDGALLSNLATVAITVEAEQQQNQAPVAANDSYTTPFGTVLTVEAPGVLTNDSDPDGGELTAVLVTSVPVASGTLALSADGSFVFTPATGFSGDTSFTYQASDGDLLSNVATVAISVGPQPNRAPVAVNDTYSTAYETTLDVPAPGVLFNDSDPDGNPLTAVLESDADLAGGLTLNPNGSFSFTPNAGFSGITSFTYRASDGLLQSEPATVTITVREPAVVPIAQNDSASTTGTQPVTFQILLNDSYSGGPIPAGATVTLYGANGNAGSPATGLHGTLTLNANNSVTYQATEATNAFRTDTFTYTVTVNGQVSNVATVTIDISAAPQGTLVAVDDTANTAFNTAVNINVLANDIYSGPAGQVLVTVVQGSVIGGTAAVNNTRTVTFTPTNGFTGAASFRYTITVGGATSNQATVTVNVAPPPEVDPVANNDAASTTNGTPVSIPVLANDTYAGGPIPDRATIQITGGPSNGTAEVNGRDITYTRKNAEFIGQDTFTYTVTVDGRASNVATVTVTVDFKAEAEVITVINIDVSTKRNGRRDITVSGTTTGLDANSMTVEILNTTGQFQLVGSSNVGSTTGAWSVAARNSQIVPASGNTVRVTSARGTVLIFGGGS